MLISPISSIKENPVCIRASYGLVKFQRFKEGKLIEAIVRCNEKKQMQIEILVDSIAARVGLS